MRAFSYCGIFVLFQVIWPAKSRSEGAKIYWSGFHGGIHRVDADGSNWISIPEPEPNTRGLAIHGPRRELYASSSFNIYRMSLDGTNPVRVVTLAGNYLAVDAVNDNLYWSTGRHIMRANLDGTETETVLASEPDFFGFGTITELGIDGAHDSLYWLENGRPFRSTLDGEHREPLFGMANLERPLTGIAASSDGTVCTSFSSMNGAQFISGTVGCWRYDGQRLIDVTPPRPNPGFDPPFLPEHVTVGLGAQPYWFNAWFGGGVDRFTTIEGLGPLTPDGVYTNRVIAQFNTLVNGTAVDDYIIPEPSTALLTLAAATLALLAALRRHRPASRSGTVPRSGAVS